MRGIHDLTTQIEGSDSSRVLKYFFLKYSWTIRIRNKPGFSTMLFTPLHTQKYEWVTKWRVKNYTWTCSFVVLATLGYICLIVTSIKGVLSTEIHETLVKPCLYTLILGHQCVCSVALTHMPPHHKSHCSPDSSIIHSLICMIICIFWLFITHLDETAVLATAICHVPSCFCNQ